MALLDGPRAGAARKGGVDPGVDPIAFCAAKGFFAARAAPSRRIGRVLPVFRFLWVPPARSTA